MKANKLIANKNVSQYVEAKNFPCSFLRNNFENGKNLEIFKFPPN